ncbi:MAG: hypothetical protein C0504_10595 [Candidatus Solibacter sp.]|nr:hypothetical protein [Candidatus Solibacter sp.]
MNAAAVRRFAVLAGLAIGVVVQAYGRQTPASQSGTAREAYAASVDIWTVIQEGLPGQIRRLGASEAESRIQAAEKARVAVNRTRQAYLNVLRGSYAAAAASLAAPAGGRAVETKALLAADKELLSDIENATNLLDGDIKAIAATDRTRAAALQKEKTDLLELRTIVMRRGRELDRIETSRLLAASNRQALAKAYARLAEWTTKAEAEASKEDAAWTERYTAMRGELANLPLETLAARKSQPETAPPQEEAVAQPAAQTAPVVMQAAGGALVPNVGGVWVLNNPRARKLPSGAYEPATARLEISQNGAEIEGSFECAFAVPPEEKFNPVVRFNFTGKITNPILRFDITAPLSGSILLRQAGGGVEVSYGISNPQRTGVAFGVVPEDGPMMLRRTIR